MHLGLRLIYQRLSDGVNGIVLVFSSKSSGFNVYHIFNGQHSRLGPGIYLVAHRHQGKCTLHCQDTLPLQFHVRTQFLNMRSLSGITNSQHRCSMEKTDPVNIRNGSVPVIASKVQLHADGIGLPCWWASGGTNHSTSDDPACSERLESIETITWVVNRDSQKELVTRFEIEI